MAAAVPPKPDGLPPGYFWNGSEWGTNGPAGWIPWDGTPYVPPPPAGFPPWPPGYGHTGVGSPGGLQPGPLVPVTPKPPRLGFDWDLGWDEYQKWLSKHSPTPGSVNVAAGVQLPVVDASPNIPIIYGTNLVRGQEIYVSGIGDVNTGHYWIAIAEGEIDSVQEVYVNGVSFTALNSAWVGTQPYSKVVFYGTQAQAEDDSLWIALGWHPGGFPGTAYVRIDIARRPDRGSWVYSLPGVSGTQSAPTPPPVTFDFLMKGKKVYDPRKDSTNGGSGTHRYATPTTWEWSENPYLHWRDLRLMSGVDNPSIDDTSVATAANVADATTWSFVGAPTTGGDGVTKRFISNLAVAPQTALTSYLDQLSLACNGHESWVNGKLTLTADVQNTSASVLTLDSAKNFSSITYEWTERRDRPSQVRIDFRNKDASTPYKPDYVVIPETLAAGVEGVEASYTSVAITDRVHAIRAASYIYNVANGTPFSVSGDCTYEGVAALARNSKISLVTSEGLGRASTDLYPKNPSVGSQPMITEVVREMATGWRMVLRQYHEDVYRDVTVTATQPINYVPTTPLLGKQPEVSLPREFSAGSPFLIRWNAPRYWNPAVHYAQEFWTVTNGGTVNKNYINDGNKTSAAYDYTAAADTTVKLDLGAGVTKRFTKLAWWLRDALPSSFPVPTIEYSDNGSTWTEVIKQFWRYLWTGTVNYGLEFEWDDAGAHRYWRVRKGLTTAWSIYVTELQFREWDGVIYADSDVDHYEIYARGSAGEATPADVFVMNVPGMARPTTDKYLDLSGYIYQTGVPDPTYIYDYLRVCILTVMRDGSRSVGINYDSGGLSSGAKPPFFGTAALTLPILDPASMHTSVSGFASVIVDASGQPWTGVDGGAFSRVLPTNLLDTDDVPGLLRVAQNSQSGAYVLVAGDNGKHVSITTGGVTVPAGVFSIGDIVTIFNASGSSQTITQGTSVTMVLAGTALTGNRTLAQYGLATVLCIATNQFVISGAGLT